MLKNTPADATLFIIQGFSYSTDKAAILDKRYLASDGKSFSANADDAHHFIVVSSRGFGPQSPRNIDDINGLNKQKFVMAPAYTEMNLCDIHIHESAEHQGGQFTLAAGGEDEGNNASGFLYNDMNSLTEAEKAPFGADIGASEHGSGLQPGDTVEIHYVYTTAQEVPGPTLSSCLGTIKNPQLRVEAQVFVLVNDSTAADFVELTKLGKVNDLYQAVNIPLDAGTPVQYSGSTTGHAYNEKNSPYQVTWSVHPLVKKVNIASVAEWFKENDFDEHAAHGVRNLVKDLALLSPITND